MIRFIVELFASKRDINGNRYYFTYVTSTKTGLRLAWNLGNDHSDLNYIFGLMNFTCHPCGGKNQFMNVTVELPKRKHRACANTLVWIPANKKQAISDILYLEKGLNRKE